MRRPTTSRPLSSLLEGECPSCGQVTLYHGKGGKQGKFSGYFLWATTLPVATSQVTAFLSAVRAVKFLASSEKRTAVTAALRLANFRTCRPAATSQTHTVRSAPPEARYLPSGEKSRAVTARACPMKARSSFWVA